MRVGKLIAGVLVAASFTGASAQIERTTTRTAGSEFESPCLLLVAGIERSQQMIENGRDRFATLLRVAGEADREKIESFSDRFRDNIENFRAQYGEVIATVRSLSDEELERACRAHRTELSAARERISTLAGEMRRFETEVRSRIATTRHLTHAIRRTDDMLVKATRISRKTGESEDAFPGLRRAYELQENAKQALAAGRLEAAMRITLKARDVLGETLRSALDEQDIEQVRRHVKASYKRTAEAVERIGEPIDNEKNPKAARLVEIAENDLAKARELVEERPYVAVRHVEHAQRVVREMRRFYARSTQCEERIGRLEERIERAREIVDESGEEKAADVLSKASEHYARGVELCQAGDSKKATVQLDIASKLTARSVELANDVSRADKAVANEIRKTARIVKKASELAETDQQKLAAARAQELTAQAKERIDQPRVSLKLLDEATDIAFSIIASSGSAEATPASEESSQN